MDNFKQKNELKLTLKKLEQNSKNASTRESQQLYNSEYSRTFDKYRDLFSSFEEATSFLKAS